MTRSPTLKPFASRPTSITSPEYSLPIGVPTAAPWLASPLAAPRSARLSAIALTFTNRSAGFSFGAGTSRTTKPCSLPTAAFMHIPGVGIVGSTDGLRLDAVTPRAGAGHHLVIAFDHLHWPTITTLGERVAVGAGLLALLRRQPGAVVAPHARAFLALRRLPGRRIDHAAAPAVLDHEVGRRPGVERSEIIAGVAAERRRESPLL